MKKVIISNREITHKDNSGTCKATSLHSFWLIQTVSKKTSYIMIDNIYCLLIFGSLWAKQTWLQCRFYDEEGESGCRSG